MEKLRTLNQEQVAAIFRTILQVLGGILIANGYIASDNWVSISGAVLSLVVTAWGVWARSDTNLIKSVAAMPQVEKVVAPNTAIANDPSVDKVSSS